MTKDRQEIIASLGVIGYQCTVNKLSRLWCELVESLLDRLYPAVPILICILCCLGIGVVVAWFAGFCFAFVVDGFVWGMKVTGLLIKPH